LSVLRAVLVTPLSGPLAGYGKASAHGLRIWAEEAASLPPPFASVGLEVHDAHPDPARAMRTATAAPPEVVFGPYGSGPTVAAAAATERVVWNHGGSTSRLARSAFPNVVNVLAPASSYFEGTLEAVRAADPAAGTVSVFHGATGFATDVARGALRAGGRLGFEAGVVEFEPGGAGAAAGEVPGADVLLVAGGFDDELAAARALLGRRWQAAGFVGAGVEETLAPLGPVREGLVGPAQWLAAAAPEPDEGPDAAWFVSAYRRSAGEDPPYPAAQAFAAGVVFTRCLREADEPGDAALLAASRRLDCTTLYGRFRLDPATGLQAGHQVLTVQWQEGMRLVVWPPDRARASLTYPLRR
jgi:branched-chain amino acid transport system substrate-binding protein